MPDSFGLGVDPDSLALGVALLFSLVLVTLDSRGRGVVVSLGLGDRPSRNLGVIMSGLTRGVTPVRKGAA